MGLMDAIGLQPRHPATVTTSVTSQGTQTATPSLQNAQTQTDRDPAQPSTSRAVQGKYPPSHTKTLFSQLEKKTHFPPGRNH